MEPAYSLFCVEEFANGELKSQMPVFAYSAEDAVMKYKQMRPSHHNTSLYVTDYHARLVKLI